MLGHVLLIALLKDGEEFLVVGGFAQVEGDVYGIFRHRNEEYVLETLL